MFHIQGFTDIPTEYRPVSPFRQSTENNVAVFPLEPVHSVPS